MDHVTIGPEHDEAHDGGKEQGEHRRQQHPVDGELSSHSRSLPAARPRGVDGWCSDQLASTLRLRLRSALALKKSAVLGLALAVSLVVGACGGDDDSGDDAATSGRLKIATTVAPITSIVASIVGDLADVNGIVPEGTNSHTFEP